RLSRSMRSLGVSRTTLERHGASRRMGAVSGPARKRILAVPKDPNPFRRPLELVRQVEEVLVERWLLSADGCTLDIGAEFERLLELNGLGCSDPADRKYVALLLASDGWIAALRPGVTSTAFAINDQGHIVGHRTPPSTRKH